MDPQVKALEAAQAVEVLRIRDNDTVFVTIADLHEATPAQVTNIRELLQQRVAASGAKNVGLIIKGSGVKVEVLRPDDAYEEHADGCLQGCDQFPSPGCIEGNETYSRKSNPI